MSLKLRPFGNPQQKRMGVLYSELLPKIKTLARTIERSRQMFESRDLDYEAMKKRFISSVKQALEESASGEPELELFNVLKFLSRTTSSDSLPLNIVDIFRNNLHLFGQEEIKRKFLYKLAIMLSADLGSLLFAVSDKEYKEVVDPILQTIGLQHLTNGILLQRLPEDTSRLASSLMARDDWQKIFTYIQNHLPALLLKGSSSKVLKARSIANFTFELFKQAHALGKEPRLKDLFTIYRSYIDAYDTSFNNGGGTGFARDVLDFAKKNFSKDLIARELSWIVRTPFDKDNKISSLSKYRALYDYVKLVGLANSMDKLTEILSDIKDAAVISQAVIQLSRADQAGINRILNAIKDQIKTEGESLVLFVIMHMKSEIAKQVKGYKALIQTIYSSIPNLADNLTKVDFHLLDTSPSILDLYHQFRQDDNRVGTWTSAPLESLLGFLKKATNKLCKANALDALARLPNNEYKDLLDATQQDLFTKRLLANLSKAL